MQRYMHSTMAYLPIQLTSSSDATETIQGVVSYIEEQKRNGKLPPGLGDQYDIQQRILKDGSLPDLQIIASPAPYSTRCECAIRLTGRVVSSPRAEAVAEEGKSYVCPTISSC